MNPDLTVVIPYFNQPMELERALSDLAVQEGLSWEAIVVDDFSSLPAEDLVKNFRQRGYPVSTIRQPERSYTLAGRLAGMRQARGRWLAFLDADDGFCAKDSLASALAVADERQCDILHFNTMNLEGDGRLTPRPQSAPFSETDLEGSDIFRAWLEHACMAHSVWNKLYSRSLYQKLIALSHDLKITRVEDFYLTAHFLLLAEKYAVCDVEVYKYSPPSPPHVEKQLGRTIDAMRMYVNLSERFMALGLDRADALELRRYLRKMLTLNLGPVFKDFERAHGEWSLEDMDQEMLDLFLKYGTMREWCVALAIFNAVNARKLRGVCSIFSTT